MDRPRTPLPVEEHGSDFGTEGADDNASRPASPLDRDALIDEVREYLVSPQVERPDPSAPASEARMSVRGKAPWVKQHEAKREHSPDGALAPRDTLERGDEPSLAHDAGPSLSQALQLPEGLLLRRLQPRPGSNNAAAVPGSGSTRVPVPQASGGSGHAVRDASPEAASAAGGPNPGRGAAVLGRPTLDWILISFSILTLVAAILLWMLR
jgi:hypothetical protein